MFKKKFFVSNPSGYVRSDYVEADLDVLEVPPLLDENSLQLFRVMGNVHEEIPYQIDYILGSECLIKPGSRKLVFLCKHASGNMKDDYSEHSAIFLLQQGVPHDFGLERLKIEHFEFPTNAERKVYKQWDSSKRPKQVDIYNNKFKFSIALCPNPQFCTPTDYTGSVTSVERRTTSEETGVEMLAPHAYCAEKRWGQLTKLVFFPLPWELRWFHEKSLLETDYQLVCSHSGVMRATVTLRSKVLELEFDDKGLANAPKSIKIKCHLYRIIYAYPEQQYYTEELIVLTEDGLPLAFRSYHSCHVYFPQLTPTEIARFEHIPDYFAFWRQLQGGNYGYGFASDAHTRGLEYRDNEIQWRTQLTYHKKCVHFFMFEPERFDPHHTIGHHGWYEQVFKPLSVMPFNAHRPFYPTN